MIPQGILSSILNKGLFPIYPPGIASDSGSDSQVNPCPRYPGIVLSSLGSGAGKRIFGIKQGFRGSSWDLGILNPSQDFLILFPNFGISGNFSKGLGGS